MGQADVSDRDNEMTFSGIGTANKSTGSPPFFPVGLATAGAAHLAATSASQGFDTQKANAERNLFTHFVAAPFQKAGSL